MTQKQPTIEKRIARVSAVTGLSSVLSIGLQLISVPVCLHYWGNDTYGMWLALIAAFTLLRTVDGGYIEYVGNKINILFNRDIQELKLTLASATWGVALLGGGQLIILLLLYITDSMGLIIISQDSRSSADNAIWALFVLTFSWMISGSYIGIVHRLLIPVGMMYQAAWWSMGFQVTQFTSLIIAAMLGLSILQAAILFALVQAVIYIASAVYMKFKLPHFYPWWAASDRAVGMSDLLNSTPFTLAGIMQQGGNSGLVIVVTAILGAVAVPAFVTIRTLSNLWTTFINILTIPLLPDVVRFQVNREGSKLLAIHKAHWLLIGSTVNISILIAYPFLETVYNFWTANRLPFDRPLLSLLLASVSVVGAGSLMRVFLSGLNHTHFVMFSAVFRGGLVLILSISLLTEYGIIGLGVAIFCTELLVFMITVLWFFRHELTKIYGGNKPSLWGWHWLSLICVVTYLLTESFDAVVIDGAYWFALIGAVLGSVYTWRELDKDIKVRIICMLSAQTGLFKCVKGAE